jgi:galactose oxidase-like protein/Kelch motif protein
MKNSFLFVFTICGLCLLAACGGSGSTGTHVGPASHFSVSAPATATLGTSISFTVTALDASNNVVTNYAGTVHFTSTDAQAVLPGNTTLTNGGGNFSATLNSSGSQTITATDTVSAAITGTSNAISVTASATHFSVTVPGAAITGTAFSFTVTALDASNNTVTSYSGTVHFTSSDAQAVLPVNATLTNGTGNFSATLKTSGSQTVTATDTVTAAITGISNAISVTGTATHLSVTAPSAATAGTSFSITVTALDASNNVVTSYAGTVHFTSSDAQAVLPANSTLTNGVGNFSATLKTLGSQTIKATDTLAASITGTSNAITVGSNAATHFSFTAPASAVKGTAFNFTVTALDAANNVASGYSGTVHFTSTDTMAVLPANSTLTNGVANLSATLKTVASQTITATDTVTASIAGTSNAIMVFSTCTPKGSQCPPQGPPCCPGLVCVFAGDRAFCEPSGAASPFSKKGDTFAPRTPERESRFSATCIMGAARESHTATLLANGLVLITGGDDRTVSLATAEMFNPDTHSFAPAGNMADARRMHTATLLANGYVLVTGGRNTAGSALATAELFDPASASFAEIASMTTARESHTTTLLSNGKVLITGGSNGTVALAAAELFDPSSANFTRAGSMHAAREFHTATLLNTGKVLVTGGRDADGNTLSTAELFDPTSHRFTPTDGMSTARESHTTTLLSDGKVLITGGNNGTQSLATAELFDPASGKFTPTGTMNAAREFHTATLRNDGTVLVAGGAELTSAAEGTTQEGLLPESMTTAELFDPASGTFTPTSDMASARARHAAILLPDGRVFVTGGINPDISALANSLASAELFQ